MKRRKKALWGGGYAGGSGEALAKISVSHPFDRRLVAWLWGNPNTAGAVFGWPLQGAR